MKFWFSSIICFMLFRCCTVNDGKPTNDMLRDSPSSYKSQDIALFKNKVLQDSLCRYLELYGNKTANERFPQIFCIYVYPDRNNDTIVDMSHSIAFRTDIKDLYGIYTKGETMILNNKILVRYRNIVTFSEINEFILQESDADSVNIFIQYPELLYNPPLGTRVESDSRVYKIISKDSLQLVGKSSIIPSYDTACYDLQ